MDWIEWSNNEFCDNVTSESHCCCSTKQRLLCLISNVTCTDCVPPMQRMDVYDKKSWETLKHAGLTLWTITPIVLFYAMARIVCHIVLVKERNMDCKGSKFVLEFLLVVVPTVLFLTVLNDYLTYVMLGFAISVIVSLYVVYDSRAYKRWYIFGGRRPFVLTLNRATINLLTVVCILAVDFSSFPKHFGKTRRYGAGLMDVGIGLFVSAMGAVSHPPKKASELVSSVRPVGALLVLGILRTMSLRMTNYEQDEHEYGRHMNAFFTLGLTKLFGTIFSAVAQRPMQHAVMGVGILGLHELSLQLFAAKFVMSPDIPRDTLITANREGIFSLPGFVALYLISHTIGQYLRTNDIYVSYHIFMKKLIKIALGCFGLWSFVIGCIFTVSIARVTCNSGYVMWVLAIALTMTFLFMIVFHLILNTLWPPKDQSEMFKEYYKDCADLLHSKRVPENIVPGMVDAVNRNGLVYFILANLLTGLVNMYLNPDDRTDFESFVILTIYMFVLSSFVCVLHHFGIRIA